MNRKENNQLVKVEQKTPGMVYDGYMDGQRREIISTKDKVEGMSPPQALTNYFLDKMNVPVFGDAFRDKLYRFVNRYDDQKSDVWSALEKLAPNDEEITMPFLTTVAEKSLVDHGMRKEGKTIRDLDVDDQKSYYKLVDYMEQEWKRVSALGTRNVEVNIGYLKGSELVRENVREVFEEKFGEIGDALFGFVEKTTNFSTGRLAKLGMGATAAAVLLSACSSVVNTPTAEVAPLPGSGEAITIGLLDAKYISELPDGEIKDNLQREIDSVEEVCGTIPNCIGGSEKIYRVVTPDTVYSMRFVDVLSPGEANAHTEILSIMDGKTQENVVIEKEVLTKDTIVDGVTTRVFGYVDDMGNSHYLLEDHKFPDGDRFNVYDADGNYYEVIAQNEKEVRAYAHLWEAPGIVNAEFLPTPTNEAPAPGKYQINETPAYFPLGGAQDSFERGEYATGMELIKGWVNVWEKMGVFDGLTIENNSLNPVVLDGRARTVCVDVNGTLFCPPIDLANGGLRAVPSDGNWTDDDKPLMITFEGTEELITKGQETDLAYQFIDKYMKDATRYIDPKTGAFVDGSIFVKNREIVENEVVEGSVVCVAKEYCMDGQMDVDPEVAKVFYEKFMDALVHSKANEEYFNNLLNGNVSLEALKTYLEANDGIIPAGLALMRGAGGIYAKMDKVLDKPVNLSALRTIVFGSKEWQNDVNGIQEYLQEYDNSGLINTSSDTAYTWEYFGWIVDENGYLILVGGSKDPENYISIIGNENGEYVPEHDNKAATAQVLSLVTFMEKFDPDYKAAGIMPLFWEGGSCGAYEEDIQRLLGGENLFMSN